MADIKDVRDGGSLSMTALSKFEHLSNPRAKVSAVPSCVKYGNGDKSWFSYHANLAWILHGWRYPTWIQFHSHALANVEVEN